MEEMTGKGRFIGPEAFPQGEEEIARITDPDTDPYFEEVAAEREVLIRELNQEMEEIRSAYPGTIEEMKLEAGPEIVIRVPREENKKMLSFLKERGYRLLSFVAGEDYTPRKPRFEVFYELIDPERGRNIRVRCGVPEEDPNIQSVEDIFITASWHERETYDLLGITFSGHSDMRRLILPPNWDGFPLRKEYDPIFGKLAWKLGTNVLTPTYETPQELMKLGGRVSDGEPVVEEDPSFKGKKRT